MAAGSNGGLESGGGAEAGSVCVDKLGANTESSIVKTGLGRRTKSAEVEMKSPKSRSIRATLI